MIVAAALLLSVSLILPDKAYAYIDPGSGSYIFQLLIAFALGAIFAFGRFWKDLLDRLRKIFFKRKDK